MNLTCLAVWIGPKYTRNYLDHLMNSVERNLSKPYDWIVITDRAYEIPNIKTIQPPGTCRTWWNKLYMFSDQLPADRHYLYFDLDTVIISNMDEMVKTSQEPGLWICQDFNRAFHADYPISNSSVMAWQGNSQQHIWDEFAINPQYFMSKQHGDQDWITRKAKKINWWHKEWVISYKWELDQLSSRTKILAFHGEPKPHQCTDELVKRNWR